MKKIIICLILYSFPGCLKTKRTALDVRSSAGSALTQFLLLLTKTGSLAGTAPSSSKAITSYSIPSLGITGTISGTSVYLLADQLTSMTPLTASFTSTGKKVTVGNTEQTSGVTSNSYSSSLIYTVTAEDGSSQNYTVTLTAPKIYGGGSLRIWIRSTSLGLSDGAQIASWTDESGYGNHFTQGTPANRPIFKAGQINGLPAARFTQSAGSNMSISAPVSMYPDAQNGSFLIVLSSAGYTVEQVILNLSGANGRQFSLSPTPSSAFLQGRNGVGYNYSSSFLIPLNTFLSIGSVQSGAASVNEYWNGDLKGSNAPSCCSNYVTGGSVSITNGALNGDIAELMYFATPLSSDEMKRLFCYIRGKYGFSASDTGCGL